MDDVGVRVRELRAHAAPPYIPRSVRAVIVYLGIDGVPFPIECCSLDKNEIYS